MQLKRKMCLETALMFFLSAASFCQQQASESAVPAKASVADLSISCQVDPATRTVHVTLVNRAEKRVQIQDQRGVDSRNNYQVTVTDRHGKLFPTPEPEPTSPGVVVVHEGSIMVGHFNPGEERVESFPLSAFAQLPKDGGRFRIKIGRGLFSEWNEPWRLDPSQILWCKPIDISLPASK